ncbi:hypothetical protein [Marinimicrobium sp. C2-29]|uniref:hypothetical protein n=1 Tax=Marinimicrobium sp. C2-29 TaxID=3139825 RepID=UPI0031389090
MHKPSNPTAAIPSREQLLMGLYEEFVDFDAYCAFFCDATAALCVNREQWLDDISAEGLSLFSQWLKERSNSLKRELEAHWKSAGQNQLN